MKKLTLNKLPYLILSLLAFGYVAIRTFKVPITVDECWTLYSYIRSSVWDIITIKYPSTNNHIFNSLLAKITTVFSEKEFFMRLPNLLSVPLYLYGSYKIAQLSFTNRILALAMFLALITNVTLMNFFGLCRGYGLSVGLLTIAIAYLLKIARQETPPAKRDLHIILFGTTMAFYANIAVLHVMAATILFTMIVLYYKQQDKPLLKRLQLPVVYSIIIIIFGGLKLLKQYNLGEIFYGGSNNFIDDTMATLMVDLAGDLMLKYESKIWIMNISVALVALSVITPLFFYKKIKQSPWMFIPWGVLVFNLVFINFQFYVLDVLLPINRIGIFFYPLMIMSIFIMLQLLQPYIKQLSVLLGVAICALTLRMFVVNMSLDYMSIWWFDMYSDKVVEDVIADYETGGHPDNTHPTLFVAWPMDNSVNYYANIYHKGEIHESPCCTHFENAENLEIFHYVYVTKHNDMSAYPQFKKLRAYHPDSVYVIYKNMDKQ